MNATIQNQIFRLLSLVLSFSLSFPLASAESTVETFRKMQSDKFEGCNWTVTYRGKFYDLTPLTKVSLSKPIDTDIRYVIERVPKAREHFSRIAKENDNARGHTFLASIFATSFFATRMLSARQTDQKKKQEINVFSLISAMLFVKAGVESWRSIRNAESELVESINAFNAESPFPIEPYESQSQIPLKAFKPEETYDAEEK